MRASFCPRVFAVPIFWGIAAFITAAESGRPAQAADMPLPVKAAEPVAYSTTGCYIGGQVGVALSRAEWTHLNDNIYSSPNSPTIINPGAKFRQDKGLIGVQTGCNSSLAGPWMVGVEGAWMGKALDEAKDQGISAFPGTHTPIVGTAINSIFSVTGRLGYNITPDWLLYVKGGVALGQIETSGHHTPVLTNGQFFDFNVSPWHKGWTVGGGVEYRLLPGVTIGAEYGYYRFGNVVHVGPQSGLLVTADNQVEHRVNADVHTVMARINFHGDASPMAQFAADQSRSAGEFSAFSNTTAQYNSWTGTRGSNIFKPDSGKGYQFYSPTTIGIDYSQPSALKVETRIKGGYVYSRHGTPGQGATYEGPVDTQASVNLTFLNFESIRPTMGVAVNLPTGTSYLPLNQRFTRMDPDLVAIGSYGAGFNVNPTAGFIIGLNQWTAMSFSGGYAWQDLFVKEGIDLSLGNVGAFDLKRRINPGEVFTGNANITTSIGKLVLLGTFAYMSETKVTIDGTPTGRAGARYVSNLTAEYPTTIGWPSC